MQSSERAKTGAGLVSALVGLLYFAASVQSQPSPATPSHTPAPTKSQSTLGSPSPKATPPAQPTPLPQSTPVVVPSVLGPSPVSSPTPSVSASPSAVALGSQTPNVTPLTLDEALRLANAQASSFITSGLNERIAAEDVRQAEVAFLPKVGAPLSYIYTSPVLGRKPGEARTQSFIANNAIGEYEALVNVSGDIDINGRLRATLAKNRALLEAAHAGTEVARHALVQAVIEAYYGLALAIAERAGAEQNLAAAEEFERITSLLVTGGEVAPVDLTRAQLQTITRRDELERARADEIVSAGALRVLIGYDFTRPIATTDLLLGVPADTSLQRFRAADISRRPEFTQLEAQLRAAKQEIRIARAERLPSVSYSMNGGFDTDSIKAPRLRQHSGVSAAVSLNIPIFDWGASRSKERQARLRAQVAENERTVALRGFTQQFYAAQAQANTAAARVRLAGQGVILAQNNLDTSIARYRAGEAQIIEVTDAQTTLVTQRLALYQAIFDYQTALGRLRQATGR
jgi:outer membrane protein TolC